jgi:hypothetical protein
MPGGYSRALADDDRYRSQAQRRYRAAGEATVAVYPGIRLSARANRAFLARAVRHLAGTEGIRQFLDIGTPDRAGPR